LTVAARALASTLHFNPIRSFPYIQARLILRRWPVDDVAIVERKF
jgi:hypothetical protein